mmetsp:Transcript_1796/g.2355  ORF Transcript_1796/g.2355 Transcript_1796/m.2355 type:complete len:136 (-) Transcript_1796:805-1212(-)
MNQRSFPLLFKYKFKHFSSLLGKDSDFGRLNATACNSLQLSLNYYNDELEHETQPFDCQLVPQDQALVFRIQEAKVPGSKDEFKNFTFIDDSQRIESLDDVDYTAKIRAEVTNDFLEGVSNGSLIGYNNRKDASE